MRPPTLADLESAKREYAIRQSTPIHRMLADYNITTVNELHEWCDTHGNRGESRYDTLCRYFGQVNSDRVMRRVEVSSW